MEVGAFSSTLNLCLLFLSRLQDRGGETAENTDMVCPSLWGREGLVSGDSAQAIQGWGWLQLQ